MSSLEIITDLMVKTDKFRNKYVESLSRFMNKETDDKSAKLTFFYNTILAQLYYLVKNIEVCGQTLSDILEIKELLSEDFSDTLNRFIEEEYKKGNR